ncbi:MAG TPA: hypothetical protein VFC41_05805, partial [Anaerovoracaceae bacterium]|nr:hypothetical protein [Anaerovoracaceae bacterium]
SSGASGNSAKSATEIGGVVAITNITQAKNSAGGNTNNNTILQISRTGAVKRMNEDCTSTTSNKRTRLDTELVKLIQHMTTSSAAGGNSNTHTNDQFQQLILQMQNQSQQMMLNFQQQQQLQQDRYDRQIAQQNLQFSTLISSLGSSGGTSNRPVV